MSEIFRILENYNFWHKKGIPTGFLRNLYLERIEKYMDNRLIKVLVGQRRVGKSYLMRQLIQTLVDKGVDPKNIFYLNKELVEFDAIKSFKDLTRLIEEYRKNLKPRGKIYILLDEVQEIDQWEKVVNSLSQDYKHPYEVFITGSNSNLLSGELATYLSGRSVSFEILPFLFEEYIRYFSLPRGKESYLSYLEKGGLPELYTLKAEEAGIHYVSSLRDTILLKDIVARFNIKDVPLLQNLFRFLSDNIGNLFSINKIVHYLTTHKQKTNHATIAHYIDYLKQTFLIHEVERYDLKGKSLLAGNKKYYLNDLAFRNRLSSGFDRGMGKNLENVLYIHYRSQGYNIYVGSQEKSEIDFILEKGTEKKYVQAAYLLASPEVVEREFGALERIEDSYEKIVVSLDDLVIQNSKGIKHVRPWE